MVHGKIMLTVERWQLHAESESERLEDGDYHLVFKGYGDSFTGLRRHVIANKPNASLTDDGKTISGNVVDFGIDEGGKWWLVFSPDS